jgi:hypothetical protein
MLRAALLLLLLGICFAYTTDSRGKGFLWSEARNSEENASSAVFPVPTTARCIVIIICQYMFICTCLAVCRTYQEFTGTGKGKVEEALRAAAQTMMYGPMLCVLFIACRMRVEFLSGGTDQPQVWVQRCMYGVTYSVMASCVLVLLIPLLTGKPLPVKEGSCEMALTEGGSDQSQALLVGLTIARYLILLCLYVGLAGIIIGINIYLPPGATDLTKLPPPAPAVFCTMVLAVMFFATQLVIALCRTYGEFKGVAVQRIVTIMEEAATTVEFGPMLAIIFLTARMRALQHDAQPQAWAQDCMYAATASMCVTTLLAIAIPLATGGAIVTNDKTKEKTFAQGPGASKSLTYCLIGLRYLCMLGFYGGAIGVIWSIYTFEAPGGPAATVPVSPTAHCVTNLAVQFFFVYAVMTLMLTISSVTGSDLEKSRLFSAVLAAKSTLGLAPMLAMLFVTTRMHALLLTQKKGEPQAWVQDGMYLCTWSLLISFVACLATGLAMDKVDTDEDGNVVNKFTSFWIGFAMSAVRYFAMLLLYGGIILVVCGLFQMTPENANGRGSVPVVSDVVNATPMGGRPPSVGGAVKHMPGAGSTGAQGR